MQLGSVEKLVLAEVERVGVGLFYLYLDTEKSFEERDKETKFRWVGRDEVNDGVADRREKEVTTESNRVSVSRAVHRLIGKELLKGQFTGTCLIKGDEIWATHYGTGPSKREISDDETPTINAVKLTNAGYRIAKELRTDVRNEAGWTW